jgi:hypothetical protein
LSDAALGDGERVGSDRRAVAALIGEQALCNQVRALAFLQKRTGESLMMIETRLRELLAELAELRQQAKLACQRSQTVRQDHRFILESARSQNRLLVAASRQLSRPNSNAC